VRREGQAREGRGAGRFRRRFGGSAVRCGAGLGLRGPGGARPPRHATTATVFVQLALRYGRSCQLGSLVAFDSGQAPLPGVLRKAPLCLLSEI